MASMALLSRCASVVNVRFSSSRTVSTGDGCDTSCLPCGRMEGRDGKAPQKPRSGEEALSASLAHSSPSAGDSGRWQMDAPAFGIALEGERLAERERERARPLRLFPLLIAPYIINSLLSPSIPPCPLSHSSSHSPPPIPQTTTTHLQSTPPNSKTSQWLPSKLATSSLRTSSSSKHRTCILVFLTATHPANTTPSKQLGSDHRP